MKHLVFVFTVIVLFTGCKKTIQQELLQNDALEPSNITAEVYPAPPYRWTSMAVPVMKGFPNNGSTAATQIIQVNGEVYCVMVDVPENSYKFNNSTKRWEPFNDTRNIFQPIKDHKQYFFSLGTKMYFGFEWFDFTHLNNFCCVDVLTGTVTSLANYPGRGGWGFSAFTANGKGYVFGGATLDYGTHNQFYEYNFTSNTWTNKGTSPLGARSGATTYVIDNLVYMGMGTDANGTFRNDWKVYNPASGYSGTLAAFPGTKRSGAKGFVMNSSIFFGTGNTQGNVNNNDFWKYSTATNTWARLPDIPGETRIYSSGAFSIGNVGYLVKGGLNKFWKYSNTIF